MVPVVELQIIEGRVTGHGGGLQSPDAFVVLYLSVNQTCRESQYFLSSSDKPPSVSSFHYFIEGPTAVAPSFSQVVGLSISTLYKGNLWETGLQDTFSSGESKHSSVTGISSCRN